jgi:hypothetical protein
VGGNEVGPSRPPTAELDETTRARIACGAPPRVSSTRLRPEAPGVCHHERSARHVHEARERVRSVTGTGTCAPAFIVALAALAGTASAQEKASPAATYKDLPSEIPAKFAPTRDGFDHDRRDVMIPMRDGVKLHTVILLPRGAKGVPILLTRTPYDAIDWLVKNVPESNGKVGILGISYDGFLPLMALVDPHPALKVSVPICTASPSPPRTTSSCRGTGSWSRSSRAGSRCTTATPRPSCPAFSGRSPMIMRRPPSGSSTNPTARASWSCPSSRPLESL